MLYACVPDLGFKNNKTYACEPMGLFNNLADCALYIDCLHNSFGYCIYPVSNKITKNITVTGGMSGERIRPGYEIIGKAIYSFNVKFSELQYGQCFIDPRNPDDVCVKTSDSGATDGYCAKGFELSFGPNEDVKPL